MDVMLLFQVPKGKHKISGVLIFLLGSLSLCLGGCSSNKSLADQNSGEKREETVVVSVASVESLPITRKVEAVGTLWPDDQVTVSAQVEGQVEKILVDVGDTVQAGQVMVAVNQEELRYQVDQRAANKRKTMAQLGLSGDQFEVGVLKELPEVKKAAADVFDKEQIFQRARGLYEKSLTPKQDLDSAESRWLSAKANYDVVLQQVHTLEAQLRSEQADLQLAQKKLRDAEIRAPFAGFVQERLVSPGQYLRVQAPVMTIVKPDPLKLRADVPENMASWVRPGQKVEINGEAFPNKVFEGLIRRITPAVKEQSRVFTIEAIIGNSNLALKPGVFVKASITTAKVDTATVIPVDALSYQLGTYKVFVVEDGRLREREVKLGDQFGTKVEAKEGLKPGEVLALHPERFKAGQPATIKAGGPS
jgi:RND family efflux transporter MFP subunit